MSVSDPMQKLLSAIDAAEESAYGGDTDGDLAAARAQAIDHYLGRNVEPAPDGRSQVIDRSVFETVQWIMPSLIRIFANGDDVVALPPIGPDDEERAKQEAEYLNHIALNKNPWFEICHTWFTDALVTKNAYLYVYRDMRRDVEIESYERQTEGGIALLLQDRPDVEIIAQRSYPDPEGSQQPVIDPATGQPAVDPMSGQPVMQPVMLYDIKLRRVQESPKWTFCVLPPERCKVSERTPTFRISECPYFEYWDYCTISDLRSEGFDVDDDIASDDMPETEEDTARNQYGQKAFADESQVDPAMRRVRKRCVWIQHDYDEDGIAELQYCLVVGKEILVREEVSRIPVAAIVPYPLPHRHGGLSLADITIDLQRIKQAILRQGLDNLYLSNNPRTAISDRVNLDDMLISRPGGVVRVDGDPNGQILPIVTPFVFPQAMEGLEYMDQVRENRTGTNRYFTGIDQNAMNKTASGIQQLSTMAAQRVELMARIFGSGFEDAFQILHELILKAGHRKETVQLRGKWVEVDPATWRKRTDFKICVGYAAGNKDAQMQKLLLLGQKQGEAMAGGLPIVTPENIYNTAIELTKAADFATPDRFWTDPSKVPPKPPQPHPDLIKTQMANESAERQKAAELAQHERESQRKAEIDKYKTDVDAQTKIALGHIEAATAKELQQDSAAHTAGLEHLKHQNAAQLEGMKGQHVLNLEHVRRETSKDSEAKSTDKTDALHQKVDQIAHLVSLVGKSVTAKKRIERDGSGRIVAVHTELK